MMKYSEIDIPQAITAIGVVITALTGLITAIGILWNTRITKRARTEAEQGRRRAEDVAVESRTERKAIYRLVNGSHIAVLKSNAANARRLAMLKDATEEDMYAARDAERLLEEAMVAEAKAEMEKERAQQQRGNGDPQI